MERVNLQTDVPAVSGIIDATYGQVLRLSWRELSGSADAVFDIYDGYGTDGTLLDTISLSAGQSTRDYYRHFEYPFYVGLYLDVVTGDFKGGLTICHFDRREPVGAPVLIVTPAVGVFEVPPPG